MVPSPATSIATIEAASTILAVSSPLKPALALMAACSLSMSALRSVLTLLTAAASEALPALLSVPRVFVRPKAVAVKERAAQDDLPAVGRYARRRIRRPRALRSDPAAQVIPIGRHRGSPAQGGCRSRHRPQRHHRP